VERRRLGLRAAVPVEAAIGVRATRAAPRGSAGALILQSALLLILAVLAAFVVHNVLANVARFNIHMGFGFLARPAGFEIAMHLIAYSAQSTYAAAFLVGVLNTLLLAVTSSVIATVMGFSIGLLRLSTNRLVSFAALSYVEIVRNIPLLLQLFFWYFAVLGTLPQPRQSIGFFGLAYLNRRGLSVASLRPDSGFAVFAAALALGIACWIGFARLSRRHRIETGEPTKLRWAGPAGLVGLMVLARLIAGTPFSVERPELAGFNFHGGTLVIPEFLAMIVGMSVFGAAFIAEIVRGGVLAVPRGQTEAALALGLRRWQIYRRIVIPQAMRVIVPPMATQYILILKNSSLGAAIAYPDLMLVTGTVLNQTGQPIDIMAITMAIYLALCLGIATAGNALNRRIQLVDP
jgi:general L-amino acid transport system permease protein